MSSYESPDYQYHAHETSNNKLAWRVYCCVRCGLLLILLGVLWTCSAITLLVLFGFHKSHFHTFLVIGAASLASSFTLIMIGAIMFKRYHNNPQSIDQSAALVSGYEPPTVAASGSSGQLYSGYRQFRPLGNDPSYSDGFVAATSPIYIANYNYLPMAASSSSSSTANAKHSDKKKKKTATSTAGSSQSSGPRPHVYSPIYDDKDRI